MTVQEATKYSADKLSNIYEKSEAEAISGWLLEHITGIRKNERVLQQKKELSPAMQVILNEYLARLLLYEPIQYVLNEAWFCGLKFYVNKNVLIPRPETEELVEWIISNCKFPVDELAIADIGTGSGCIPLALKKRLGKARVHGYDISAGALAVAAKNAALLGIDVEFSELDFLDPAARKSLPLFDIIVSNPPYIPASGKAGMQANVVEYEPQLALFVPDSDPLIFYKVLADFGKLHLAKNGALFMEIHEDMGEACSDVFRREGYTVEIKKDMQGKDRMIKAVF